METGCEDGIYEIAKKVAKDMELVSGKAPVILRGLEQIKYDVAKPIVLFATIGKSRILNQFEQNGVTDLTKVSKKNEVFGISLIEDEKLFLHTDLAHCCSQLLLIYGSDKRGTIYGMFHLSELMGVSPLVYWGDVKPIHKDRMEIGKEIEMISKEPSVRYRGFFINDEWPCFGNWTTSHFGGFTADMYDHVFELLLRLKGNYLWPAMWSSSFALDGPGEESAKLADLYGVIIGNSHHEPCLRAGEEEVPGLREWDGLEDIILMFCEDNFGHMRYLPQKDMPHAAGYGMYYHLDYHGDPISYEWINSTPLSSIWEQMTIAYEQGVREVWIVNVGDLKGNEFPLSYFLTLAYDFETWGSSAPNATGRFTRQWLKQQFKEQLCEEQIRRLSNILTEGILLIGKRRPEALGADTYGVGDEACRMLARVEQLENSLKNLETELPDDVKDAFYSLIYDQLRMGLNLIQMQIYAGFNQHYARQGKTIANSYADRLTRCIQMDRQLIEQAGKRNGGKWSGMWNTSHIGFQKWNEDGCRYPLICRVEPVGRPRMVVSRRGELKICQKNYGSPDRLEITDLGWNSDGEVVIEIANDGIGSFSFTVEAQACDWFTWEVTDTTVKEQEYLYLRRNKSYGPRLSDGTIFLRSEDTVVEICVRGIMDKRKITVMAKDFTQADDRIVVLSDFGKEESAIKAYPFVPAFSENEYVYVSYHIGACSAGDYRMTLFFAPSNQICRDVIPALLVRNSTQTKEWCRVPVLPEHYCAGKATDKVWATGVITQQHCVETPIRIQSGINELELMFLDGITVLEKIELEHF